MCCLAKGMHLFFWPSIFQASSGAGGKKVQREKGEF